MYRFIDFIAFSSINSIPFVPVPRHTYPEARRLLEHPGDHVYSAKGFEVR